MPALYLLLSLVAATFGFVWADTFKENMALAEIERNRDMLQKEGDGNNKLLVEILERLDRQESRILVLEATVLRQQEQNTELTNTVNKQTKILKEQDRVIRKLRSVQRDQETLINAMDLKLKHDKSVESKYSNISSETKNILTEPAEETEHAYGSYGTDNDVQITKTEKRGLTQFPRESLDIAFSTVLQNYKNLGYGQKIIFDVVLLNVGSAYHHHLGAFIAPTRGVYYFSTSLMSIWDGHTEFEASIVNNGFQLVRIYGHGSDGRHDQGSSSVTIQLEQGDEIWVQYDWPTGGAIWGNKYSSFNGYLLFAN